MSSTRNWGARTFGQSGSGKRRSGKSGTIRPRNRETRRNSNCQGDDDEDQFKGFPCTARGRGQPRQVADDCEAILQVEEAVSRSPARTYCGVELAPASSLRVQPPVSYTHLTLPTKRIV